MLLSLPRDVLVSIFEWVDLFTLVQCREICTTIKRMVDESEGLSSDLSVGQKIASVDPQEHDMCRPSELLREVLHFLILKKNCPMLSWFYTVHPVPFSAWVIRATTFCNDRTLMDWVKRCSDSDVDIDWEALEGAAAGGHLLLLRQLVKEKKCDDWGPLIFEAARGGHVSTLAWCYKKMGPIELPLMYEATHYGRYEEPPDDYVYVAMYQAAQFDHLPVLRFLVEEEKTDWDAGLKGAASGGHLYLVVWFASRGANEWGQALSASLKGYHMSVYRWLLRKEHNRIDGPVWRMKIAAQYGHTTLVRQCIDDEEGALQANSCYRYAAQSDHIEVIDWLFDRGVPLTDREIDEMVYQGSLVLLQWLASRDLIHDWDRTVAMVVDFPHMVYWIEKYHGHRLTWGPMSDLFDPNHPESGATSQVAK